MSSWQPYSHGSARLNSHFSTGTQDPEKMLWSHEIRSAYLLQLEGREEPSRREPLRTVPARRL
jgi:hypothetical protein